MTQDPAFANTIGWLEANRQRKLRGFVDGGPTTGIIGNIPTGTDEAANTNMVANAINNLNAILAAGIKAYALIG